MTEQERILLYAVAVPTGLLGKTSREIKAIFLVYANHEGEKADFHARASIPWPTCGGGGSPALYDERIEGLARGPAGDGHG
jgi:hypothetical protein